MYNDETASRIDDSDIEMEGGCHEVSPTPDAPVRRDAVEWVAQIVSYLFGPLLMPVYGMIVIMWLSVMDIVVPAGIKLMLIGITFGVTCVTPVTAILLLWRLKVIGNPGLTESRDRTVPYLISAICYIVMGIYLNSLNASDWLSSFMYGGAAAVIIDMFINLRWKISGHATAQGGLLALMFYLLYTSLATELCHPMFLVAVFIAGAVCTSRLILNRHTLWQLAAGLAVGFVCVYGAAVLL